MTAHHPHPHHTHPFFPSHALSESSPAKTTHPNRPPFAGPNSLPALETRKKLQPPAAIGGIR